MTDEHGGRAGQGQAHLRFDTSPQRFRDSHPEDTFSGSSGVLFERAMAQTRMAICLTDPKQDDNPIVFANRAFRSLTGYHEDEIIGRNCRFLQGPGTDDASLQHLRDAIETQDVVVVELLNYRKDGSSFWNALHLGPIYDDDGELAYYFGSQWDVSDVRAARSEECHAMLMARELSHRMKNMFAVISGIVNITGRVRGVEDEAAEINQRIQALGRAYETTLDEASTGAIEVGPAIRAILSPYEGEERLLFTGNGTRVNFGTLSILGMVLQELAENAIRHGAWTAETGQVTVGWKLNTEDDCFELTWKESGGPSPDPATMQIGSGTHLTERLLRSASGAIERDWQSDGLLAVARLPA